VLGACPNTIFTYEVKACRATVVKECFYYHLANFNLINNSQNDFIKNCLCLNNLLECLKFVCDYFYNKNPVKIIYLDFQKAFDKVLHKRLMLKLQAAKVSALEYLACKWITLHKDWQTNRV